MIKLKNIAVMAALLLISNIGFIQAAEPVKFFASQTRGNNVAANTFDGDLSTRWSSKGDGQYIQFKFEEAVTLEAIKIAFHKGDKRQVSFRIESSDTPWKVDPNWQQQPLMISDGTSLELQTYTLLEPVTAKFFRIVAYGYVSNNGWQSEWNSITEVAFIEEDGPIDYDGNRLPAVTVSGNKVVFGGEEKSLAGYSLFWSNTYWGGEEFYNARSVTAVKNELNSSLIRAAMGVDENGGYLESDANKLANQARVEIVVDTAIENDMYVLIDWHTHHAEDHKEDAITFFTEMATKYGDKNNVIYEIYNEPLAVSWSDVIKPYALDVIKAIRAIDPDNLIIVGTPNWSQDVDVAALDPITGYDNIAYTLHFYAATHGSYLRSKATTAMTAGLPLFVTEWGAISASGDGDVDYEETALWMDFLQTNKISHLNWALNDKQEGASVLIQGAGIDNWSDTDFTASGTLVNSNAATWPDQVELVDNAK